MCCFFIKNSISFQYKHNFQCLSVRLEKLSHFVLSYCCSCPRTLSSNGLISYAAEIAVAYAKAKTARYQTNLVLLQSHNSRDCPQDSGWEQEEQKEQSEGAEGGWRTQSTELRTQDSTKGKCDNANCTISTRKQLGWAGKEVGGNNIVDATEM